MTEEEIKRKEAQGGSIQMPRIVKESFNDFPAFAGNVDDIYEPGVTGSSNQEQVDLGTRVKYAPVVPDFLGQQGYGDINNQDIFPSEKTLAGYVQTPSWGTAPLIDTSVRFPLSIYYKNKRAIQELMLANARKPEKQPGSLQPVKVSKTAPNIASINASLLDRDIANVTSQAEKTYGDVSRTLSDARFLNMYSSAINRENARANASDAAYTQAQRIIDEVSKGQAFYPQETVDAAREVLSYTDRDFQTYLSSKDALQKGEHQAIIDFYDDKTSKFKKGLLLSSAAERVIKNLEPDAITEFQTLTPEEKARFNNDFAIFFKTYLRKNVPPERINELSEAVASESPSEIYNPKTGEKRSGQQWTVDELSNFVKKTRGITETTQPVPVYTKPTTSVRVGLGEEKSSNAVATDVNDIYRGLIKSPNEKFRLSDKAYAISGGSFINVISEGKVVSTRRKDDWEGIAKDIIEYRDPSAFSNVSISEAKDFLSRPSGASWRDELKSLSSQSYKETDEAISKVKEYKNPSTKINWSVERGGVIPISDELFIHGAVSLGQSPNDRTRESFKVKIGKDIKNVAFEGVIVPKKYVSSTDSKFFPNRELVAVSNEDQVLLGSYVPDGKGNYNVAFPDGSIMKVGESNSPITLTSSYIESVTNPSFERLIGASSSKAQLTTGTPEKGRGIGNKPVFTMIKEDFDANKNSFKTEDNKRNAQVVYSYYFTQDMNKKKRTLTPEQIVERYNNDETFRSQIDANFNKIPNKDDAYIFNYISK